MVQLFVMIMDKTPFSEHSNTYFTVLKVEWLGTDANNRERFVQRIPVWWGRSHQQGSPTLRLAFHALVFLWWGNFDKVRVYGLSVCYQLRTYARDGSYFQMASRSSLQSIRKLEPIPDWTYSRKYKTLTLTNSGFRAAQCCPLQPSRKVIRNFSCEKKLIAPKTLPHRSCILVGKERVSNRNDTQFLSGRSRNGQEEEWVQRDTRTHSLFGAALTTRTADGKVPTRNLQLVRKQSGNASDGRQWGNLLSRNESRWNCRSLVSQIPRNTGQWCWLGTQCLRCHRGRCDGRMP